MDYKVTLADGSKAVYHHGVKGQRWGVRRTPEELGYGRASRDHDVAISREREVYEKGFIRKKTLTRDTDNYLVEGTAKNGQHNYQVVGKDELRKAIDDMEAWIDNTDIFNKSFDELVSTKNVTSVLTNKGELTDDDISELTNGLVFQATFRSLLKKQGYTYENEYEND